MIIEQHSDLSSGLVFYWPFAYWYLCITRLAECIVSVSSKPYTMLKTSAKILTVIISKVVNPKASNEASQKNFPYSRIILGGGYYACCVSCVLRLILTPTISLTILPNLAVTQTLAHITRRRDVPCLDAGRILQHPHFSSSSLYRLHQLKCS